MLAPVQVFTMIAIWLIIGAGYCLLSFACKFTPWLVALEVGYRRPPRKHSHG